MIRHVCVDARMRMAPSLSAGSGSGEQSCATRAVEPSRSHRRWTSTAQRWSTGRTTTSQEAALMAGETVDRRTGAVQCIGFGLIAGGVFGLAGVFWGMIAAGCVFVTAGILRKVGLF